MEGRDPYDFDNDDGLNRGISLKSGSCHLDRALNVKIGVECQIFVVIFFICDWVLQFGAHSSYYKGALTQKRSFLVICTTFRSVFHVGWKNQNEHSTLNLSFDALSKWHEPDINQIMASEQVQFLQTFFFKLSVKKGTYFGLIDGKISAFDRE